VQTLRSRRASVLALQEHQVSARDYVHGVLTVAACMELIRQTRDWEEFQRAAREYRKQIPLLMGMAKTTMRMQLKSLAGRERTTREAWIEEMLTWRRRWMGKMADYLEQTPRPNYDLVMKYKDALGKLE